MTSHNSLLIAIENIVHRLELPLSDALSPSESGRRLMLSYAIDRIHDSYDLSLIDSAQKDLLLDLVKHAFVRGGLL